MAIILARASRLFSPPERTRTFFSTSSPEYGVYDIKPGRAQELVQALGRAAGGEITIENNLRKALSRHRLVVDATNAAEIIHASDISSETYIAAPGMPLGLSRNALKKISDRLLHDPLQIGVATMAVEVLKRAD